MFRVVLLGVPLLAAVLWLASGHEILSKAERAVDVEVKDPLFGDTIVQKQFVRGPVFGCYVGLDSVIVISVASLAIGGGTWLLRRQRDRRKETV